MNIPANRQRIRPRDQGIATVEFAVSVVGLLVMMMVVAELGRAYYTYNTLTQSVRTGARYLSTNALTAGALNLTAATLTETRNIVTTGNPTGGTALLTGYAAGNVTITSSTPSGAGRPYITVASSYPYTPLLSGIPATWLGQSPNFALTLNASNTMRALE